MKYIKKFENTNIQQPFYLSKDDYLYISNSICLDILPNKNDLLKVNYRSDYILNHNYNFIYNVKNEKGYRKSLFAFTIYSVKYNNNYKMNITIKRRGLNNILNTNFGEFDFYITGNSGDYEMHGKNMIRATRECNLNFIIIFYPIVKYINNFYKIFKEGKLGFLDIIKNEIDKNPSLAKYGIPNELKYIYGDLEQVVINSEKYNL